MSEIDSQIYYMKKLASMFPEHDVQMFQTLLHEFLHVLFAARTVFGGGPSMRPFSGVFAWVEEQTFRSTTIVAGRQRDSFKTSWSEQDWSDSDAYEDPIQFLFLKDYRVEEYFDLHLRQVLAEEEK